MTHLLASTLEGPAGAAMELVRGAPSEVVAVALGAAFGVGLFWVVWAALSKGWGRRSRGLDAIDAIDADPVIRRRWGGPTANDVVVIPRYRTNPACPTNPTQMNPTQMNSENTRGPSVEGVEGVEGESIRGERGALGFTPTSALSARALTKMGFSVPQWDGSTVPHHVAPASFTRLAVASAPPHTVPSAMLDASCVETGPSSVVTMADASSALSESRVMRAASFADLDLDDGPTELCEPLFGESPVERMAVR